MPLEYWCQFSSNRRVPFAHVHQVHFTLCTHSYTWTTQPIVHFADAAVAAAESTLVQFQVPFWQPICLHRRLVRKEEVWRRPSEELDKTNSLYLCNLRLTPATIKQPFKELHHLFPQPFRTFPSIKCPSPSHTHLSLQWWISILRNTDYYVTIIFKNFLLASWCSKQTLDWNSENLDFQVSSAVIQLDGLQHITVLGLKFPHC